MEHFTAFGFQCKFADSFDDIRHLKDAVVVAVMEFEDQDNQDEKAKIVAVNARFKIAVCRLRSPKEVRNEPGIHAIISRHIKRDSLQNIVDQLLSSGTTVQPLSRHIPYV